MSVPMILMEIDEHRIHQKSRYSDTYDDINIANDWVAIISRYAGKAACIDNNKYPEDFKNNMVKIGALSVAAIEAYERYITRMELENE